VSRFAFIAAFMCAAPAFADTAYIAAIPDLPIAEGLEEAGDNWEFSDAGVRVFGAAARGRATAGLVRAFYQDALPALGWALSVGSGGENETVYLRGREQLELSIHQRGEDVLLEVRVFVNPAPRD
jgi:hypothetical protein